MYKDKTMSCPSCRDFSNPKEDSGTGDHKQPFRNSNTPDLIQVSGTPDETETRSSIPLEGKTLDSSSHLLHHCPAFRNIAVQKNFEDDKDIVSFYQAIIDYWMEHNEDS